MQRLVRSIDVLNRVVGATLFLALLAMVLMGAANAVARYVGAELNVALSSNRYLEAQWYLFSVVFLLGGAYTLLHDGHVRVDVVYDRLTPRPRRWINRCGHAVFLIPFCMFVVWLSWEPLVDSWSRSEGSPNPDGLLRYPIKAVIPAGFVLLALQALAEILRPAPATPRDDGP